MPVVENTTYRLAAGVDEADFLAADYAAQTEFFPFQQGFLRRTTARDDAGEWLACTWWATLGDARAAADAAAADPAASRLLALLDRDSVRIGRYLTLD